MAVVADLGPDQPVALVQAHGDLAVAGHADEVGELVAADLAAGGGEEHAHRRPGASSSGSGITALMLSPSDRAGNMLIIARPRACGVPSGRR